MEMYILLKAYDLGMTPVNWSKTLTQYMLLFAIQDESKEGLTPAKIAEINQNEEVINYFQGEDYTTKIEVLLE